VRSSQRKTTPKVRDGRVQKKDSHAVTNNYYDHPQPELVIDRKRPGPGHRHLLSVEDVREFIKLIPNWNLLSHGPEAIVLCWDEDAHGWSTKNVIAVCSWPRDLWIEYETKFFESHRELLERLGVEYECAPEGVLCKFTEQQAKAFQLLHIFLHELGHQVDRMAVKNPSRAHNGEPFAEGFAYAWEKKVWDAYFRRFPA
jgi:hypothetical protein